MTAWCCWINLLAKIQFFHLSAPFVEEKRQSHDQQGLFDGLIITGECRQVFSCCSQSECHVYKVQMQPS